MVGSSRAVCMADLQKRSSELRARTKMSSASEEEAAEAQEQQPDCEQEIAITSPKLEEKATDDVHERRRVYVRSTPPAPTFANMNNCEACRKDVGAGLSDFFKLDTSPQRK